MKTISRRTLKRSQPEAALAPGETPLVKQAGKPFELGRLEAPRRSHLAGLEEAMREVPNQGGKPTNVAAWCAEDDL